jgi:uncharacterized protein YjbI with pentapeptide repeats
VGNAHPTECCLGYDCCIFEVGVMTEKPQIEDKEILRLYASGVRDFTGYEIWINQIVDTNLSGVDFSGQDLSESYLEGIDFSGANLSETGLNQVCLDRANLSGANLTNARFVGG